MKIDWVLCEFYEPQVSIIIDKILKNTKNTKIISYGNLFCKNKNDLEIIYKILIKEYLKKEKTKQNLPNLLEESIKQYFLQM